MHTKSYKSQVQHSFFKWHALGLCVVPLWPAALWLFGGQLRPLWACWGAALEHVESSGAEVNSLSVQSQRHMNYTVVSRLVDSLQRWNPFICYVYRICPGEWHSLAEYFDNRSLKLTDMAWIAPLPHHGKVSMRMALAGWLVRAGDVFSLEKSILHL